MAIAPVLYDVTWGRVRLWCARIATIGAGRTQVVHELAETQKGEHPVQDRGPSPRSWRCEVLFVEMPAEPRPPAERFAEFLQQIEDGERLLFVHPLEGAHYVNAGDATYTLDEDGNLENGTASIEFHRSADVETPILAGAETSIAAGQQRLEASAGVFADALADVDIDSDITDRAVAAQAAWEDAADEDGAVPTRQVIADLAGLSNDLNTLIEEEGLENDLDLWDAFKAAIMFGAALRAAALAAMSEAPKVTAIRIGEPMSVLALAVRLYGGAEAEDRVRQILALNTIATPAWIPAGSVITVPVPRSSSALRAA